MIQKKYIPLIILIILISVLFVSVFSFQSKNIQNENRYAIIQTNIGNITIELLENIAPQATNRFIDLANNDFYNGTIIHRVFKDYAIYGGQYQMNSSLKPYPYEPITIETDHTVKHKVGAMSLLRSAEDQTKVGCQFLICLDNISSLDGKNTIIGYVRDGIDLVFKISRYPHDDQYQDGSGRILNPFDVVIDKIIIINADEVEINQ